MSKKDEAFELFDEGKVPSSPEVKALGLKGTTKYNYCKVSVKFDSQREESRLPRLVPFKNHREPSEIRTPTIIV